MKTEGQLGPRAAGLGRTNAEVTVAGVHFLPEDSAEPISDALTDWLASLP